MNYIIISFFCILHFSLVLLVYLIGVSPQVAGGDSGEILSAICQSGVIHPPGYPILTVLSIFILKLTNYFNSTSTIPPALIINILNSIFSAFSSVFLFLSIYRVLSTFVIPRILFTKLNKSSSLSTTPEVIIALTCSLCTSFQYSFSSLIGNTQLFLKSSALNNLLSTIIIYLSIEYSIVVDNLLLFSSQNNNNSTASLTYTSKKILQNKDTISNNSKTSSLSLIQRKNRILFAGAFISGLGISNQHTIVLFLLIFISWILLIEYYFFSINKSTSSRIIGINKSTSSFVIDSIWSSKNFSILLGWFLLGLSPYIYLFISYSYSSTIRTWGQNGLTGFLTHFLRKEYGTFSLAKSSNEIKSFVNFNEFSNNILSYLYDFFFIQSFRSLGLTLPNEISSNYTQLHNFIIPIIMMLFVSIGILVPLFKSKYKIFINPILVLFMGWLFYILFFFSKSNLSISDPIFVSYYFFY